MKKILLKIAQWKFIIPLFLLAALFNFYLFPKHEVQYNNESLKSLDTRTSYTKGDVMELFSKMGEEGRRSYEYSISVIDMIYPIIYGMLLILLLSKLIKNIFREGSNYIYLSLLPIFIMIFDYAENTNTLTMLSKFPEISDSSVVFGSLVSGIKWYSVSAILMLLITGILYWIVKKILMKKQEQKIS